MRSTNSRLLKFFTLAAAPVLWATLLAGDARANSSLVLLPGSTAAVQTPSQAPFTSLSDTRIEMRIHNWSTPASNTSVFWNAGFNITLRSSGEICAYDWMDATPEYGGTMCADITGQRDITLRVQRDTKQKLVLLEVQGTSNGWVAGTYCGTRQNGSTYLNTFPCPIATVYYNSWAGTGGLGDANTNVRIAWLKWHSSVVPMEAGLLSETAPADLADWRFEGGMGNQASGGPAVAISALQMKAFAADTAAGGMAYMPSGAYPPTCLAGAQKTFRAGYAATLDGSGSYPLDGNDVLKYSWEQVSGPTKLTWSSKTSAQPSVNGMAFGSYVFKLTVTDGSDSSNSCTVKHGAVYSDDNGVVATGNSGVDALLGPIVRFGANPWPWYDDRHKAAANLQIKNLDAYYGAYWDIAGPGAVTVTSGSAQVYGAGTTFTKSFCQGPGDPTTPQSGAAIIVWYDAGSGQTGRRQWYVTSCQSDTQLTLNAPWKNDVSDGVGLQYAISNYDIACTWAYNAAPANYYDNVAGFYSLYYRTGIDDYLTAARKLADRFWTSPQIDRGAACVLDGPGCFPARSQSTMGLILRALDGRPDMWSGFHKLWDTFMGYYLGWVDQTWGPGMWDLREEAYHLAMISYCAMFDTDASYRANCKQTVSNSFPRIWTPYKAADGSWPQFYSAYGLSSWETGSSVTLTNGSATVTGNNTRWDSSQFGGFPIWFTNDPTQRPADNSGGDNTTYIATFIDATHIRLNRPYAGASGVHGWVLANGGSAGLIGWGSQPFIMGIASAAFDLAAKAIADTDPANSALAHSYNVASANWILKYGYWPQRKGLYYGAQHVNCQAPIADNDAFCTANNGVGEARVLNAEAIRGIMTAYAYSQDPALKSFADTLYSAMFSKPGTGGPNSDGYYISALDDGNGWYMIGAPPTGQAPKYFGMFFGFASLSAWPGYRVGGLQAAQTAAVQQPAASPDPAPETDSPADSTDSPEAEISKPKAPPRTTPAIVFASPAQQSADAAGLKDM